MNTKEVTIGLVSLGCAKNQVDLETVAGRLEGAGFRFSKDPAECDIMVVNTCGFIQSAVEEAIDTILEMRSHMPQDAKLVVFGCMTERYGADVTAELPEVDFYDGVYSADNVLDYISQLTNKKIPANAGRYLLNEPYFAYLKIADGCNNRCAYCAIPSIRGASFSRTPESLLAEAKALAEKGVIEFIIISQDCTKYGMDLDGSTDIAALVEMLATALPNVCFRLMYLNPDGVTDALIDVVAKFPNVLNYFEIPIQHASDKILKKMNRHSDATQIKKIFSSIRAKIPEAFIRTTIMVGFPGETAEDFLELENFLKEYKPDFAGFFPYSPEEGTPAASFDDVVPARTVSSRIKKLQKIQKKNTTERLRKLKEAECFIERPNEDFDFILEGRAWFQAPEVDGMLYVTDIDPSIRVTGPELYNAKIEKVAYPDVYVKITE
jgi:ribosomal protein S12 methylthiotransferase